MKRKRCGGACLRNDVGGSCKSKSNGVVFTDPSLKGECEGGIVVSIGGVGIGTGTGVCKYLVVVAGGRVSCRGETFGIDEQGLECTSDGAVLSVM